MQRLGNPYGTNLQRPGKHEQPDQPAEGYSRWVTRNEWHDGTELVTVIVTMPRGGRLEISRAFGVSDQ